MGIRRWTAAPRLRYSHAYSVPHLVPLRSPFLGELSTIMAIEFRCSQCDKKLKVKDELAGKKIKCPGCGDATAVPAAKTAEKQELDPELGASDSILNLNLKKFKNRPIDPDDEDVNLDELEGAVVIRKRREQQANAKPPSEPLQPIDWVLGLMCSGIALIFAIVLMSQGKKSRGTKLLVLCLVMFLFYAAVVGLFIFSGVLVALRA